MWLAPRDMCALMATAIARAQVQKSLAAHLRLHSEANEVLFAMATFHKFYQQSYEQCVEQAGKDVDVHELVQVPELVHGILKALGFCTFWDGDVERPLQDDEGRPICAWSNVRTAMALNPLVLYHHATAHSSLESIKKELESLRPKKFDSWIFQTRILDRDDNTTPWEMVHWAMIVHVSNALKLLGAGKLLEANRELKLAFDLCTRALQALVRSSRHRLVSGRSSARDERARKWREDFKVFVETKCLPLIRELDDLQRDACFVRHGKKANECENDGVCRFDAELGLCQVRAEASSLHQPMSRDASFLQPESPRSSVHEARAHGSFHDATSQSSSFHDAMSQSSSFHGPMSKGVRLNHPSGPQHFDIGDEDECSDHTVRDACLSNSSCVWSSNRCLKREAAAKSAAATLHQIKECNEVVDVAACNALAECKWHEDTCHRYRLGIVVTFKPQRSLFTTPKPLPTYMEPATLDVSRSLPLLPKDITDDEAKEVVLALQRCISQLVRKEKEKPSTCVVCRLRVASTPMVNFVVENDDCEHRIFISSELGKRSKKEYAKRMADLDTHDFAALREALKFHHAEVTLTVHSTHQTDGLDDYDRRASKEIRQDATISLYRFFVAEFK